MIERMDSVSKAKERKERGEGRKEKGQEENIFKNKENL